jgi:hypothetical protein
MEEITLSPGRVESLLYDLCVKYGYCLPPGANRRLINSPPKTIDRFLDVVITIEGLDPRACDHRKEMRAIVERYFVAERESVELSRVTDPSA